MSFNFSTSTWITIIFAAILAILLIILVIVTVNVLKKKDDNDDYDDYDESEPEARRGRRRYIDRDDRDYDDRDDRDYDDRDYDDRDDSDYDDRDYDDRDDRDFDDSENGDRDFEEDYKDSEDSNSDSKEYGNASYDDASYDDKSDAAGASEDDEACEDDTEDDSEYEANDDIATASTIKLDIDSIKRKSMADDFAALSEQSKAETGLEMADDDISEEAYADSAFAKNEAEEIKRSINKQQDYSEDSAFAASEYENPVNKVSINTVNSDTRVDTSNEEIGISGEKEMEDFLSKNPAPAKRERNVRKDEQEFEDKFGLMDLEIEGAKYFWYNSQDIAECKRKEDMYFHCHYFDNPDRTIRSLIAEMYDCAYVKTEELQYIAYGIKFVTLSFREVYEADKPIGFDKSLATKEPSEMDKKIIYRKWCEYVDSFLEIIVINASEDVKAYIRQKLYDYGNGDVDRIIYNHY